MLDGGGVGVLSEKERKIIIICRLCFLARGLQTMCGGGEKEKRAQAGDQNLPSCERERERERGGGKSVEAEGKHLYISKPQILGAFGTWAETDERDDDDYFF